MTEPLEKTILRGIAKFLRSKGHAVTGPNLVNEDVYQLQVRKNGKQALIDIYRGDVAVYQELDEDIYDVPDITIKLADPDFLEQVHRAIRI